MVEDVGIGGGTEAAFSAPGRAVYDAVFGQKRFAQKGLLARGALEAVVGGVPVLALVRHLALVDADRLAATVAVLGVHALEALAAERLRLLHDVALAAQLLGALVAREVIHVPALTFRFCALIREDYLITSGASGLQQLGVVTSAVHALVRFAVEVDEVDEELATRSAREARRMPAFIRHRRPLCKHSNLAIIHRIAALFANKRYLIGKRYEFCGSTSETIVLPLLDEKPQLIDLIIVECVTIARLVVMRRQLLQQLLDAMLFADRVHVGNFVLGDGGKVLMHLVDIETRWHPRVFLQGAAGVVVGVRDAARVARQGLCASHGDEARRGRVDGRCVLLVYGGADAAAQ